MKGIYVVIVGGKDSAIKHALRDRPYHLERLPYSSDFYPTSA
jgi:hypothetical protein